MALPFGVVTGLPGMKTAVGAQHRLVFKQTSELFLAQGKVIDGTKSRDPDNTSNIDVLRAGLVMGKVSASGKYAPSIIGVTAGAYAGGTSLTLTVAAATEVSRRIGASGTFRIAGPPSAAGTMATEVVTYSAINTTTGVATITTLSASNYISGSIVQPNDGSEDAKTIIPDGFGVRVTGFDGSTAEDQPFPQIPIWAVVISANVVNWPSDTSLQAWLKGKLGGQGEAKFTFDDNY